MTGNVVRYVALLNLSISILYRIQINFPVVSIPTVTEMGGYLQKSVSALETLDKTMSSQSHIVITHHAVAHGSSSSL